MRLPLIAHDNKEVDLVAWATLNRETLARFDPVATNLATANLVIAGLARREGASG